MIVLTAALLAALFKSKPGVGQRVIIVAMSLLVGYYCYASAEVTTITPPLIVTPAPVATPNEINYQILSAQTKLVPAPLPITSTNIINLTNRYRLGLSENPVTVTPELTISAQAHLQDLLTLHYWSHSRPGKEWIDWFTTAGIDIGPVGENLARCYPNANQILSAWEASPEHRVNLANPLYRHIGVATGLDPLFNCTIVVQQFSAE